jgi:hypothetical protein
MYEEIIQLQKFVAGLEGGTVGAAGIVGLFTGGGALLGGRGGGAGAGAGAAAGAKLSSSIAGTVASVGAKLNQELVSYKRLKQQLEIGLNSGVGKLGDPALDKPQVWSTTQPRTHNVSFPLFNTVDFTSLVKNWELCHLLCYQNLYNKRNLFTGLPPVYYEITIPGVHYCKAGYISKLNISNIGNIHRIELPVGPGGTSLLVNIPDAYLVNLTINDFFIPSKNFLDVLTSDKSRVSSSATNFNNVNNLPEEDFERQLGIPTINATFDPFNPITTSPFTPRTMRTE